ncbi:MAG: hypothetical protein MZV64_44275 [Ignavibacteriales bacterium]|nr:hypothetical protein [Ignavibacteriales bacterium]
MRLTPRSAPPARAEFLLVVLPVPVAATLALLVHPRSIRALHPRSTSHSWWRWRRRTRTCPARGPTRLLWVALGYAVAVNAMLIPNIADRRHYESVSPQVVLALGLRQDTSAHFFPDGAGQCSGCAPTACAASTRGRPSSSGCRCSFSSRSRTGQPRLAGRPPWEHDYGRPGAFDTG